MSETEKLAGTANGCAEGLAPAFWHYKCEGCGGVHFSYRALVNGVCFCGGGFALVKALPPAEGTP